MNFLPYLKFYHLLLIIVILSNVNCIQQKVKTVTTLIDAKWEITPLVLEVAEYIEDESKDDFWNYLNDISSLKPQIIESESDQAHYNTALKVAEKYLSELQIKALKLALSLHIFSPKIEMFGQIASECGVPESRCPAAIHFNGRLFCNAEEFVHYYKDKENKKSEKVEVYDVDHVYPGSENKTHVAVLYAELGTSEFSHMHSVLQNVTSNHDLTYVFRHYVKERPFKRVRLSGYGVELQMKSTEYKVMDDSQVKANESAFASEIDDPEEEIEGMNFYKLRNLYPDQKENLDKFRSHLLETSNEMAPLKVWQVQELSLQAAERILSSSSGEEALKTMTHIAHNFPLQARSLIRIHVRPELKAEILKNQETFDAMLNLSPNEAAIFINGMYFDVEVLDVISLLEVLRQELRTMERLHKIGVEEQEIKKLISLDLTTSSSEYAIDIRDSAVVWFNDIESDKQYRKWSDSLLDLLRPTFPGMLRSIRRNLYNLVLIVDPSKKESKPLLKLVESFYINTAPLRLGIVFALTQDSSKTGTNNAGIAMLNAFNYVAEAKNPYAGLSFITDVYASTLDEKDVTVKDIQKKLKEKYPSVDIDQVFGEDSAYDTGRKLSVEFLQRSGFRKVPQALLNGIPLSEKKLNAEDFEEGILTEIMSQTPQLQKAVFKEEFRDTDNAIDFLMGRPNVMPRLNERILSENALYLDFTGSSSSANNAYHFEKLSVSRKTGTLLKNMRYFTGKVTQSKKPHTITHWIVADFDEPAGRNILRCALEQMKSSAGIRVGIIVNPLSNKVTSITELIIAALGVLNSDVAANYILKILQNEQVFEALEDFRRPPDFLLEGLDVKAVAAALRDGVLVRKIVDLHRVFVKSVLKFKAGERGVVTNGRVFGPFDEKESFVVDDFALLDRLSYNNFGQKILQIFNQGKTSTTEEIEGDISYLSSDTFMQMTSILASRTDSRIRFKIPLKSSDQVLSSVTLPPLDSSLPSFDIVAIVDPVSKGAQKIGPILSVLYQTVNCHIRVYLNCVEKNSDLPLKSFYKYVLEPELQFHPDGRLTPGPMAKFTNLPTSVLFTQNMHVPENWIVESIRSPYDLDNIKLDSVLQGSVHSEFELEYLLLEGHCFEAMFGNPPRGLQITLGTEINPVKYDTIVMANLGYFQLKANPGAWTLRLREGRSSEIYNIISTEGDAPVNVTDIKVIISSFRSHVLKLKVQKKPDKIKMDLLSDDDQGTGIWNSITSSFGSKVEETDDVINIFSLASGHLYERFIKIMMLSVIKNTKTPVKFWFLKNYLSPTLKDFLPHMAKEYGFEYELVEYKWPRWLHQQSEKQRIIWGYKILFLDVLFPLHVKKIIFVDADQVVRADMKELRDLDLGGAPYGYTPFCNSRREMDGFRFWNQGYWRNHLQGRRYHISALYVVDLKRFRRIAAGDRLRGQYQALSKDPNSLSNLDQDLPNNMIHQVAIKSLPEEWLWCETWCDDVSKTYAKTIDLCNNPLTKEAKLTAAMRIIEEWKDYDHEIKELERKTDLNAHAEEITTKPPPEPHVHSEL